MKRTMSSDRPLGALSDSISVTNPYLYWSISMWRTRSMVSCTADISSSPRGFKDRGLAIVHVNGICFQTPPVSFHRVAGHDQALNSFEIKLSATDRLSS